MNTTDFEYPEQHPYDMLRGFDRASEKESVLAIILRQCIEAGEFIAVETKHSHPTMVIDGLLEEVADRTYKLTTRAIGLLYSVYGKS